MFFYTNIGLPISLNMVFTSLISENQHRTFGGEIILCDCEKHSRHGRPEKWRKHHGRRFLTTEEKIERLNEYKKWLDNESKGVDEAISKLKKNE
jgi:hypothetical protein